MAAAKSLIALVDGVFVRVENRLRRIDQGVAVPQGADADHVKVLKGRGLVGPGEPTAGFVDPQAGRRSAGRGSSAASVEPAAEPAAEPAPKDPAG